MNFPSWFHGRLMTRVRTLVPTATAVQVVAASRSRVALRFTFRFNNSSLALNALNQTYTFAGTEDPVTGAIALTGTSGLGAGSAVQMDYPTARIGDNAANVTADVNVIYLPPFSERRLSWFEEGDYVCSPLWLAGSVNNQPSVSIAETVLIEGTIDDYVRYCRARE